MQASVKCPRCNAWNEFVAIPEPITANTSMLLEKTLGEITNIKTDDTILVCKGCLEDYGIEWIDGSQ